MNKTSLLATLAIVASAPLSQAALISINLTNADFQAGGAGWTAVNGSGTNSMSAQTAVLAYDNTQASLLGDTIALRVMSMDADLGSVAWNRTGMVDDFSVNATAVPEPATYGLMGAGALASAAFVRRRKRA